MIEVFIFIIVVAGLSLLILGHEAGHFLAAKLFGLKVDEFGFGFPPRIFSKKKGETKYSFNWLPFGGFVKIAGEEEAAGGDRAALEALPAETKKRLFLFQPAWKRAVVLAAGAAVNFALGWVLISSIFLVGAPPLVVVSEVQPGSPAAEDGIKSGDIIERYAASKEFIDFVNAHRGTPITVNVRRGDKELSFTAVPRTEVPAGQGALGVLLSEGGIPRLGVFSALAEGFRVSAALSQATLAALYELVKNLILHGSLEAGVVGPVGIVAAAEQTGQIGLRYLIQLLGIISINLAVMNLIPFPVLDGGKLFLILIERIKGSPVSLKVQVWVNGVGVAALATLMLFVTVRDIARWF